MAKHVTRKNGAAGRAHTLARKAARNNKRHVVPLDVQWLEREMKGHRA